MIENLSEFAQQNESAIRLIFFLGIFVLMAIFEALFPRRKRLLKRGLRWPGNIGIVFLNTVILRLLFPFFAVGMAIAADQAGWGLFKLLSIDGWLAVVLAVLLLDLAIYLQHVMVHAVPALWRLHRMHHADTDFDVTTGARFHPVEIVLSMLIKMGLVSILGPPVLGVIIFEILLNGTSMFNHANLKMPVGVDRILRLFVVTPDMHRVHHSVIRRETNSNFGFNLPWWDHLFGTYREQPADGHSEMQIGLNEFRDTQHVYLHRMLLLPFVGRAGKYPITDDDSKDGDSPGL